MVVASWAATVGAACPCDGHRTTGGAVIAHRPSAAPPQSGCRSAPWGSPGPRPGRAHGGTAAGLTLSKYGAEDSAALVPTIRVNHAGQTVLVVAHANAVDAIAGALGMPGEGELADSQFDRMLVIVRNWCGTRLTRLRYGAATP